MITDRLFHSLLEETNANTPGAFAIRDYYGTAVSKNGGIPLIRHIRQGVGIMLLRGAYQAEIEAFQVHPIFQTDEGLTYALDTGIHDKLSNLVILLAMEYRGVANTGLRTPRDTRRIAKSPIPQVNEMLIADKVQNRWSFETYRPDHPEADDLREYFAEWLSVLGISEDQYQEYAGFLGRVL